MKPYFQDDLTTIYLGDSRDIVPLLPSVDLVVTDPPYSLGRAESEFQASGNITCILHEASLKAPTAIVFGTSSGRGIEFLRSSIRALPHNRVLCWNRTYVNSPAAGPWRWDLVLIHVFGKGSFGRPEASSLIQTNGTQGLAKELGHPSPVPVEVFDCLIKPFSGTILDPFCGVGSSLMAARALGVKSIGIEVQEKYCETAVKRFSQEVMVL